MNLSALYTSGRDLLADVFGAHRVTLEDVVHLLDVAHSLDIGPAGLTDALRQASTDLATVLGPGHVTVRAAIHGAALLLRDADRAAAALGAPATVTVPVQAIADATAAVSAPSSTPSASPDSSQG